MEQEHRGLRTYPLVHPSRSRPAYDRVRPMRPGVLQTQSDCTLAIAICKEARAPFSEICGHQPLVGFEERGLLERVGVGPLLLGRHFMDLCDGGALGGRTGQLVAVAMQEPVQALFVSQVCCMLAVEDLPGHHSAKISWKIYDVLHLAPPSELTPLFAQLFISRDHSHRPRMAGSDPSHRLRVVFWGIEVEEDVLEAYREVVPDPGV
eukprot:1979354-Rhodomonas_salina.2